MDFGLLKIFKTKNFDIETILNVLYNCQFIIDFENEFKNY